MEEFIHRPVMLSECIDALNIDPAAYYLDGTLGGGGHSTAILERLETGCLIAIDRDLRAIENARRKLAWAGDKLKLIHGNFGDIGKILDGLGTPPLSGMLFDLGTSSHQLDTAARGFSYMSDARLDMRMDETESLTAYEIVNSWPEEEIRRILQEYGEERYSGRIAHAIVRDRESAEIETTLELVEIIRGAMPGSALREKQHPAKRSFQAIRIAVNDEVSAIQEMMETAVRYLAKGGRLVVISFHSLEDRIVKNVIGAHEKGCTCPRDFPVCICGFKQTMKSIGKKVMTPGSEEISENPRARSAKMRVAERV